MRTHAHLLAHKLDCRCADKTKTDAILLLMRTCAQERTEQEKGDKLFKAIHLFNCAYLRTTRRTHEESVVQICTGNLMHMIMYFTNTKETCLIQ